MVKNEYWSDSSNSWLKIYFKIKNELQINIPCDTKSKPGPCGLIEIELSMVF